MPPGLPADSLRAALDSVFTAPQYVWEERPDVLGWLGEEFVRLLEWIDRLKAAHPTAHWWLVAALVVVLVAILVHGGWTFLRTIGVSTARDDEPLAPRAVRQDARWFARAADALAREGRHAEAIQAAFLALVLRLDARGLVRYHPSKTPAEYARDPRLQPAERVTLSDLVRQLYAYGFAGVPCGAEDYRQWRERAAAWGGAGAAQT